MKPSDKNKYKIIKKILSIILTFGFLLAIPASHSFSVLRLLKGESFFATPQSERDHAQDELDEVKDNLNNLEDELADIEDELSQKAAVLSDLLADQAILENDIAQTQVAIDQAQVDLAAAKEQEAESYEAMKLRIQYMYENSTQDSIWDAILNAKGITDLLNRVEYVSKVHEADRELMEEYKAVVTQVEDLAVELDIQMNDLVTLQEVYEHQEIELEAAMAELEAEAEDFEEQVAVAEQRANQLADYIAEQNRLIELQRQEELRRQQEQNKNNNSSNSSSGGNKKPSTTGGYLNDPSYDPPFTSNVTGEELVNYALQFVGNPYKWGGNSLTNGCDCSGFVNLIYRHFGFKNVPRQSQSFKSYGEPVAFDNLKAGDIVVYPGHVAIYIGNGKIVEAQSSREGITCTRSVTCHTITAIRRAL